MKKFFLWVLLLVLGNIGVNYVWDIIDATFLPDITAVYCALTALFTVSGLFVGFGMYMIFDSVKSWGKPTVFSAAILSAPLSFLILLHSGGMFWFILLDFAAIIGFAMLSKYYIYTWEDVFYRAMTLYVALILISLTLI